VQLRRKDYAAAIADASTALDKTPKAPSTLFVRGLARLASGDVAGAKADLAAARAIRPTIDEFYANYGLAAPGVPAATPAQPSKSAGDKDGDEAGDDDDQ